MKTSKKNRKETAVIYTRVSTDEQRENGFSLQDQLSKLQTHCERNNIEVLGHYQDEHSAKSFNRPGFNGFMNDIKAKKIKPDLFICVRPDRFSRNLENTIGMLAKFKTLGIQFKTLENHTELDSPESLLPFMIYNLMPQIDNERRGLNTKHGMRQAKREGRTMGRPPLGYLNEKFTKTVVFDPKNAPLLKLGFEELSKGIYTVEEVRRRLIKQGLSNCCKQSFLNHVRNPYYCGLIVLQAYKDEPEEEVVGQHPALITRELFDEVQNAVFGKRKKPQVVLTRREELPLRGFLYCNYCDGKLTGSSSTSRNGSKHFYYHCQKGCKERFRADLANSCFEGYLNTFKISENVLNLYKIILEDVFSQDEQGRFKQIIQVEDKIAKIDLRLKSLRNKFLEDVIAADEYHSMKISLQEELDELIEKKQGLSVDKSSFQKYLNYGVLFLFNMKNYYVNADLDVKQKIIGSIFPGKTIFYENKYRTVGKNKLLELMTLNINEIGEIKNGQKTISSNLSTYAPPLGLEPRTL